MKQCIICGKELPPRGQRESLKRYTERRMHAGKCRLTFMKENKKGFFASHTP